MTKKIQDAIDAVEVAKKAGERLLAEANDNVTKAVSEVFVSDTKVKINGKDTVYNVVLVEGQDVVIRGKGASKKILHFMKLSLA